LLLAAGSALLHPREKRKENRRRKNREKTLGIVDS